MGSDTPTDGAEQQTGDWIGEVQGLKVRPPGEDASGPILEIHGEEGMAAMEFDDAGLVEGLTHAAAEIQLIFDNTSLQTATDGGESDGE